MTDKGNQLALTLHFQPQNAEPVFGIMKSDSLNETSQPFKFLEWRIRIKLSSYTGLLIENLFQLEKYIAAERFSE